MWWVEWGVVGKGGLNDWFLIYIYICCWFLRRFLFLIDLVGF